MSIGIRDEKPVARAKASIVIILAFQKWARSAILCSNSRRAIQALPPFILFESRPREKTSICRIIGTALQICLKLLRSIPLQRKQTAQPNRQKQYCQPSHRRNSRNRSLPWRSSQNQNLNLPGSEVHGTRSRLFLELPLLNNLRKWSPNRQFR